MAIVATRFLPYLIVPALLGVGPASPGASPVGEVFKCGGLQPEDWGQEGALIAVDGSIEPESTVGTFQESMGADDVLRVYVTCWSPHTAVFGRPPAIPTVYLLTKSLRADIGEALRMVGGGAGGPEIPGLQIDVERVEGGWSAVASRQGLSYRCAIFVGAGDPPLERMVDGEPSCTEPSETVLDLVSLNNPFDSR